VPYNFIQINISAPNAENIEMAFKDKNQKYTELIYKIKLKCNVEQMTITVFFLLMVPNPKQLPARAFDVPEPARRDTYLHCGAVFPEKLTGSQLVKTFLAIYAT